MYDDVTAERDILLIHKEIDARMKLRWPLADGDHPHPTELLPLETRRSLIRSTANEVFEASAMGAEWVGAQSGLQFNPLEGEWS